MRRAIAKLGHGHAGVDGFNAYPLPGPNMFNTSEAAFMQTD